MIVVECLHDGDALPWQADWYRKKVEAVEGPDADERYRLWYVDNANHTDPTTETQQTHAVAYSGTVQYALRELSAWIEQGIYLRPPANTGCGTARCTCRCRRQNERGSNPWSISR